MPAPRHEQSERTLRIGVDVGGTFTDLVAADEGSLRIVKVPSTPPEFHKGVIEAVSRLAPSPGTPGEGGGEGSVQSEISDLKLQNPHPNPLPAYRERGQETHLIHGSTVATNALLQRAGEPIAFVTTEGFRDMLLIGRQNRPKLYALRVERPAPITPEENWFSVRERIGAGGEVVEALALAEVDRLVETIQERGLK